MSEEKNLQTLTMVVYALQAVGFLVAVTWIVAVVINYVKKEEVAGIWVIYRIVKGWLYLNDAKPLPA